MFKRIFLNVFFVLILLLLYLINSKDSTYPFTILGVWILVELIELNSKINKNK